MSNDNKFVIATENGQKTRKAVQFEISNKVKKGTKNAGKILAAFVIVFATIFFNVLANDSDFNNKTQTTSNIKVSNQETRTESDNLLATVNIQNIDAYYSEQGTGTIIKMDNEEMWILTARHVLSENPKMTYIILFADGSETIATTKYISNTSDWSILSIPIDNVPISIRSITKPAIVELETPTKDENVYNIRFDYLEGVSIYNGKINDTNYLNINLNAHSYSSGSFIETDYSVKVGSSGGALFNENGRIIGICSQADEVSTIFYPIEEIVLYLNEN